MSPRSIDASAPASARGLRGRLYGAFVMQGIAIGLATLLGVHGAMLVLRDVLLKRALVEEAAHFWDRLDYDPGALTPDTKSLRAFLRRPGQESTTIPGYLRVLKPGYHQVRNAQDHELVFVDDHDAMRLWLVVDRRKVDALALWFGLVPLTLVLASIYLVSWLTYRTARRAVSPVTQLADVVRDQDPTQPDWRAISDAASGSHDDDDVVVLAEAIRTFAVRNAEFVERERNFTRDASHELRTPLTVIKVAADVLEDEALSAFGQRSLLRIRRAARDMEALIQAFLILSREADVGLPTERFSVNQVAEEEVERARDLVVGKPVEIRIEHLVQLELDAPPRVFAVLITNLLRNAAQYTDEGHVTLTVGDRFVRVEDTGCGMAQNDLAMAFEPFFRAGKNGTGRSGHGVGLTIVRRLADRFGWAVSLESTLAVGTRATIALPTAHRVETPIV